VCAGACCARAYAHCPACSSTLHSLHAVRTLRAWCMHTYCAHVLHMFSERRTVCTQSCVIARARCLFAHARSSPCALCVCLMPGMCIYHGLHQRHCRIGSEMPKQAAVPLGFSRAFPVCSRTQFDRTASLPASRFAFIIYMVIPQIGTFTAQPSFTRNGAEDSLLHPGRHPRHSFCAAFVLHMFRNISILIVHRSARFVCAVEACKLPRHMR